MKKLIKYFFIFLISFPVIKTYSQYKFEIKGNINNSADSLSKNNINDSDFVILRFLNFNRIDTAFVHANSFSFKSDIPYPSIAMLEYKYGGFALNLDNSDYQFTLTLSKLDNLKREYQPTLKTNSIFYNTFNEFRGKRVVLNTQKSKFQDALRLNKNSDSALYYNSAIKEINDSLINHYEKLNHQFPNSYLVAYVYPNIPEFTYEKYIGMYSLFSDSIKNSFYGRNFYNRLMASKNLDQNRNELQIASIAKYERIPIISGIDTSFNKISLNNEFYKKNQYTIIEFWASWCGPCKKINQDLKEINKTLKDKNICIVGFSLDNNAEAWKISMMQEHTDWMQISDLEASESQIVKYFDIQTIPFNLIINSSGTIVAKNLYGNQLNEFLGLNK